MVGGLPAGYRWLWTMYEVFERAKKAKDDEFYTRYEDVSRFFELALYVSPGLFAGKTIVCPCDRDSSAFVRYFTDNFSRLGLARLKFCWFDASGRGGWAEHDSAGMSRGLFAGDGDVCSGEVARFIDGSDFLFTNPPFSEYKRFSSVLRGFPGHIGVVAPLPILTTQHMWGLVESSRLTPVRNKRLKGLWFDRPHGNPPVKLGFSLFLTSLPMPQPIWKPNETGYQGRLMANYHGLEFPRFNLVPPDYTGVFHVPCGVLAAPMGGQIQLQGVTQRWDAAGGERYRKHVFSGKQRIYHNGVPAGLGNWLNLNACYQIDGPDLNGVSYEYDGKFFKLIFSRVVATWADK